MGSSKTNLGEYERTDEAGGRDKDVLGGVVVVGDDLLELKVDKVLGIEGALFLLGLYELGTTTEEEIATSREGAKGKEGIGELGGLCGGRGGVGPSEGRLC